jgi:hypothetical protein
VVANVQNWVVGQEVVCPKCGKRGKVGVDKFRAKGRVYEYWTVRHYEGSKVKRCVIGKVEEVAAPVEAPAAQAGPKTERAAPEVEAEGEGEVAAVAPVEVPAFEEAPAWERKAWHHIVKVNASWGSFRENPTEENFKTFVNTVQKTAWRVGVPCHYVIVAAENFFRAKSGVAKGAVNNAMQHFSYAIREAMKKQAEGTETAAQPAQAAPQPTVDFEVARAVVREEVAKAVEAVNAIRDQFAAIQKEIEYIREQVRQRKGAGARAVVAGERRIEFREGNMYWMIREIMRAGGEWTKEQIAEEIKRRFNREVSGNSVSGRISEMAAAGYVQGRREGRTWYWRWVGP